jgi:prepilin-type N-terminal cleavage/methylation domain-containing protein
MRKSPGKNIFSKANSSHAGSRGFSLIEMLIAMTVGLVVLGAMYNVFTIQNKTFGNQEEIVAMQQSVRAGMDMMAREVGMAGYDPALANSDTNSANDFSGVTVSASKLQIKADLDGNGAIDATSQENIVYAFNAANKRMTRNIGAGAQPFVENVDAFTFEYLDGTGSVTAASATVRRIRITIIGRTARPDPAYSANGGYRTYTLTSIVSPRNLAF